MAQSTTTEDLLERVRALTVWTKGGERAPHKPLLLLMALARLQRGQTALPFAEAAPQLAQLLREFGPSRRTVHPEYPFWRLQNDGLWQVTADGPMRRRTGSSDVPAAELRAANAVGQFPAAVAQLLLRNPALPTDLARELLDEHFPETLHEDIATAIGLVLVPSDRKVWSSRRPRDPNFRGAVLTAYEYRCAVCGLDVRHGALSLGLEAAHIKWHLAAGPDEVANSLCLCVLHHKLFDYGAFHVDAGGTLLVSEQVTGTEGFDAVLMQHHGRRVRPPVRLEHHPASPFISWHHSEVFKKEARPIGQG